MVSLCATTFSRKLLADVELLLNTLTEAKYSAEVLDIAANLDKTNQSLVQQFPSFEPVPIQELFPPFIHSRIEAIGKSTEQWATEICEHEEWEPSGAKQYTSSSIMELMRTIMDPVNVFRSQSFLDPALSNPPTAQKSFLMIYGDRVVAKGIQTYATQIYRQFFGSLPFDEAFASKLKRVFPRKAPVPNLLDLIQDCLYPVVDKAKSTPTKDTSSPSISLDAKEIGLMREELIVTKEMCVMVSNLSQLQELVKRLAKQYEKEFRSNFSSTLSHLEVLVSCLVTFLVFWVCEMIICKCTHSLRETGGYRGRRRNQQLFDTEKGIRHRVYLYCY